MRAEAVQKYLMWGRVLGATGEQEPGGAASLSFGDALPQRQGAAIQRELRRLPGRHRPLAAEPA